MGIPEDIAQFEQGLNELIIKYEQYFLGLEKREPLRLLETVERLARKYANVKIVNTMLSFKYNSLISRLNSYRQYWNRILRLMEEGRYSRDRFRMAMHQRPDDGPRPTAPPAEPSRPVVSAGDTDEIYRQFVAARAACGLSAATITRDMVAAAIERQRPAIVARYGDAPVEFRVMVEGGVPKIKARLRR
ncbi:MXAN_5187 C-terminal domain-containing protein [Geobacter sp.]|uniref:MXAN_5187 C-terminal domain-containing protein n=1 Tax=Geobacter sp. TaxID=46610 RepID=UPI00260671DA|nr:MXAN_5187 C-terminal domain-containing protein [Geobacter sp.]